VQPIVAAAVAQRHHILRAQRMASAMAALIDVFAHDQHRHPPARSAV